MEEGYFLAVLETTELDLDLNPGSVYIKDRREERGIQFCGFVEKFLDEIY